MRIGSLFSGYGGLDMGVQQALGGGTVAWHCEFDAAPSKILAHHWPEVPNLGDITTADWSQVEPVDVITGGFPCQDVSHAGRRQGLIRDGEGRTRSGLWGHMLRAIDTLRPALVVAENVRGLLSARADSDVEPCPWCLGDDQDQPAMRALGAVLADLADIGYDAAWCGLRAADVGAPHGRFRVFITAWPADAPDARGGDTGPNTRAGAGEACLAEVQRRGQDPAGGRPEPGRRDPSTAPLTLFKTPTSQLAVNGGSQHPDKRRDGGHGPTLADEIEHLLPTPRAGDGEKGGPNQRGSSGDLMLPSAVTHLLPTPEAADGSGGRRSAELGGTRPSGAKRAVTLATALEHVDFGDYAAAITRWEQVLGRPAPAPTEATGRGGAHRLSPAFVEWLMGLPGGHVTDVPDITRNAQLKALGNGVVPQQAATAVRHLLTITRTEAAA